MISVLFVDHEDLLLEIGKHELEETLECIIHSSKSPQEALRLLRTHTYDLIISEYDLPGINGIDFLKCIRSQFSDIPVIIVTGKGNEEIAIEAYENGVDQYIQKKTGADHQEKLIRKLKTAIHKNRVTTNHHNSEVRYQEILDHLSVFIFIIDSNLNLTYVSPSSKIVSGYTSDELIGRSVEYVSSTLFSGNNSNLQDFCKKIVNGEHLKDIELIITRKDQTETFVSLDGVPLGNNQDISGAQVTIRDITQYKQTELSLNNSEEKFFTIFKRNPVPLTLVTAINGTFNDVNDAFLKETGYRFDEIIGKTAQELNFFVDESEYLELSSEIRNKRFVQGKIVRCRTKNNDIRVCRFSSNLIIIKDRPYILSSVEDITRQCQIEEEIKEREQKYQKLFEANDAGIALLETLYDENDLPIDFTFLEVNSSFETLIQLPAENIIGKTLQEFFPESDSKWMEQFRQVALSQKTSHHQHFYNDLKKYLDVTVYATKEGQIATLMQDVSHRVEYEYHLRETNAYLENLISNANGPIIVWDSSFLITRINHSCELLIGRNEREVYNKPVYEIFPPDKRDSLMRLIKTTQKGVRWDTLHIDIQHQDGSIRSILWNSSTIYGPDGSTPIATIAQGRDITSELLLEKEKEKMTIQIQENISKLSILNDGIRNPLAVISLYIDSTGNPDIITPVQAAIAKIDDMINTLDIEWVRSINILEYLRKHEHLHYIFSPDQVNALNNVNNSHLEDNTLDNSLLSKNVLFIQEIQAQLYTILDSIDAYIHVVDIESYEVLYINKEGRRLFGDVVGQKCYKGLSKNRHRPHISCNLSHLLRQENSYEIGTEEYYDPSCGRWFERRARVIRWTNGRKVKLEIATDITERKKADESLRYAQEKFSKAFISSPNAILISEYQDGRFIEINHAASQIYGYSTREMIGRNGIDLKIWKNEGDRDEFYRTLQRDGNIRSYELIQRRKSGEFFIASVSAEKISINGKIYLISIINDITEQKRSEKALQDSEEKFRSLVEYSLDGTFILDLKGNVLFANRAAAHMVGAENPEEIVDKTNVIEFITKESMEAVIQDFENVAVGIDGYTALYKIRTRKADIRWIESNGKRIVFQNEQAILISIRDVTERKHTEDILQEKSTELRQILSNMNKAFIIWHSVFDERGRYISFRFGYFNDIYANITGLHYDDVQGKDVFDIWPDTELSWVDVYGKVAITGIPFEFEMYHQSTKGWYHCNAYRPTKSPDQVCVIFDDITEQKASRLAYETLVKSMIGSTGMHALHKITENVYSWLKADCVYIGEISPDGEHVKILSMLFEEKVIHNFSFSLKGTPSAEVIEKGFSIFPDNIKTLFPGDKILQKLNFRGYMGTQLRNSEEQVIGVLGVLSRNRIDPNQSAQEIMDIIAVKAAAEMEREQIEQVLHNNQIVLAEAMNQAKLAHWEFDINTGLFQFNDQFYALYGTSAIREGGYYMSPDRYAQEFLFPTETPMVGFEVKKALEATDPGYTSHIEHRIVRRDGEIRHISVRIALKSDGEGTIIGSHGVNQDITEQKRTEESLKRANNQLNLLSSITRHDILNNIAIGHIYIDAALQKYSEPALSTHLHHIQTALDTIQSQIEFTRIYENLGTQNPQWIDVQSILPYSRIPLHVSFTAEVQGIYVYADPILNNAFSNLLDNSIRHGERVTKISITSLMKNNNLIIIWEDNGVGILSEEKELIFEQGFGENTGFGLFLIREILSITGLSIIENGRYGYGARFEIFVPEGAWRR